MITKSRVVAFRMTPEEFEMLRIMGKREKRKHSEMMRELIREAAFAREMLPAGLVRLEKMRGEFGRDTYSKTS